MHPYLIERVARDRQLQLEREAELARLSASFPHRPGLARTMLRALLRRSRRRLIVLPEPEPSEWHVLPEHPTRAAVAEGVADTPRARGGDDREALVR